MPPVYPKRRYRDASEPAVGDVIRMDNCDHDGNQIESQAWSEAVIADIRLGAIATLHRPHLSMLDGQVHFHCEVFEVDMANVLARFHVLTTGWRGAKQNCDSERRTCLWMAGRAAKEGSHLARCIGYRLCPGCSALVVGPAATYCPECSSEGCAA